LGNRPSLEWTIAHRKAMNIVRAPGRRIQMSQPLGDPKRWKQPPTWGNRHPFAIQHNVAGRVRVNVST
jgi:hypothetical protein